jgi:hypothetical protein
MRTTMLPLAAALLMGLVLAACSSNEPRFPYGTAQQPTASPGEVQKERPQAQQPGVQ